MQQIIHSKVQNEKKCSNLWKLKGLSSLVYKKEFIEKFTVMKHHFPVQFLINHLLESSALKMRVTVHSNEKTFARKRSLKKNHFQ